MDFRRTRLVRLIPLALGATLVLFGLSYFAPHPHDLFPDDHHPYFPHGHPPPPPPGLFGGRPPPPPHHLDSTERTKWTARAEAVKDAFKHAYGGYLKHAGEHDELLPVSAGPVDNFNGWCLTMVDSLDTMLLMGFYDEFHQSIPILANSTFALDEESFAPFFETVIRYLGGLLSAYALSGESILLSRADDLGSMLLPAFDTGHGLPMYAVNTATGKTRPGWTGLNILWAEALSCQVEYKYLAHLTGRKVYFDRVERIMDLMNDAELEEDRFPTKWLVTTGKPANDQFSVGAFADSAHEYLLKQYLLSGQTEPKALDLYLRDISAVLRDLLYLSPTRGLLYVTDTNNNVPSHTLEHLSCFLPGLLALGAHRLPLSPRFTLRDRERHMWAAQGLAQTCWLTYADAETGLGPDEVRFTAGGRRWLEVVEEWEQGGRVGEVPPGLRQMAPERVERDYRATKPGYFLRPETVESFYVLWKVTGDEVWRERGWAVFEAIEKHAKTQAGYASLHSVYRVPASLKDEMPSFFTAETLKYLYLLFSDVDLIPLDRWVFNTEAHPLPVFEWATWEKERYGIPMTNP